MFWAPGIWDESELGELLLPIDRDLISAIPLSIEPQRDMLIWHHEKNGTYSVRTGYNVLLQDHTAQVGCLL